MISTIVLTKNNADTVEFTLKSLRWSDEIIIIDDNSDDETRVIAKKYTDKIFIHSLNQDFSKQRNFAILKAKHQWVFFVDSDEIITDSLKREIFRVVQDESSPYNGFYIHRKDFFLGRWLANGETQNVRLLRLAKKTKGKWVHPVHEEWIIEGLTADLQSPIIHHSHSSVGGFLKKINTYSSLKAQEDYENKKRITPAILVTYPIGKFLNNYFIKRGFMDGEQGIIMALMMSFHSFLVKAKIYLLQRGRIL
jgi:glycosyltransferase involved in cell wall biosynthesis